MNQYYHPRQQHSERRTMKQANQAERPAEDGEPTAPPYKPGIGRLLLLAREMFFQRVERATAQNFDAQTLRVCSPMLPFIDVGGTRSVELARRMGVTKQAVGPKINTLVDRGLVECTSDPVDRRSYLINFTPTGLKFKADVLAAVRDVEKDLEREIGADALATMRDALTHLAYTELPESVPAKVAPARKRSTNPAARATRRVAMPTRAQDRKIA
ncbi:MAG: MarR family transcriptional regulator [Proteobacteria bacterium]|nr:MarR family transcriptional regulator [Pseudomonadota bacterium]